MAKAVEITFAIGASLVGSFNGTFGRAGQALTQLQKQTQSLQKTSGQITAYQKMQGTMAQTSEKLNAARMRVKELGQQMRSTNAPTDALKKQFAAANVEVHRLEATLGNQRKKLGDLRKDLQGAGVDTKNLASNQSQLTEQARRATSEEARLSAQLDRLNDAQTRLQNSRAALAATREQLSWNNIRSELVTAAGAGMSLYAPTMQAANFEQAMARVNAVAFSGGGRDKAADAYAFKALQEQARQLGRDTQYTATQAANTQEVLARAGFNSNEILASMPGLLSMAAAEGMDLANAADIAASTLRGFNLSADQSNRIADVLAQTSAASNTSIAELGDAMKYVAPQAAGLGISVEEVSAMLGVFADAGIKGSQGGTALRAAFNRLSKEPKAVEKALGALGVKSRDANGNMRDMTELLTVLHSRIKGFGNADQLKYLGNIFGTEAAPAMLALMNSVTEGKFQEKKFQNYGSTGELQAILDFTNKGSKEPIVSMEEMREGMQNIIPIASQLGISFKDLSIYTALLARSGIKGAEVDKGLTAAFTQLADKPEKVQKALKQFNISAYDKDGKMREFPELIKEMSAAVIGMEQSKRLNIIESIFGKNSGKTIQALMKTINDETMKGYNDVANTATGISKEMSEKMLNTLRGQMTIAGSAVESFMIEVGNVLLPYATTAVKAFSTVTSGLVKLMQDYPKLTKIIVSGLGAFAALKVALASIRIGSLLLKMPFQMTRVAFDILNARALVNAETLTETGRRAGLFSKVAKGLSNSVKGIGKAFVSVGKGIGTFFKSLWSMGTNLAKGLFSPLGLKILLIGAAIAAVAATAYLIYKNWDKIKEMWNSWTFKDIFAPLKEYAAKAKDYVVEKWSHAKTQIAAGWNDLKGQFGEKFPVTFASLEKAATNIVSMFGGLGETIHGIFTLDVYEIGEGLITTFESAFNVIGAGADFVGATWEQTKSIISSDWDKFRNQFGDSYKNTFDGIEKLASESVGFIEGAGKTIKGLLTFDFSGAFEGLLQAFSSACGMIKGAWESVTGFIKDTWDTVSEYVSGAWKWTKSLFGVDVEGEELESQLKDITALNKMSEGFSQRVAEMTAAWQPFKGSLAEGFQEIYSIMQGIADKIRGVTIPAVNELTSALSKIATEISSIVQAGALEVEVKAPNVNTTKNYTRTVGGKNKGGWIPHALGGIFSQPHIGLVAEAGREAIIPLENQSRGMQLWIEAGRELGAINTTNINSYAGSNNLQSKDIEIFNRIHSENMAQNFDIMPSVINALKFQPEINVSEIQNMNNVIPHAKGGIFSQPHIGLVAEAGREAVIPLENQSRGMQLWIEAGRELGAINTANINNYADSNNLQSKDIEIFNRIHSENMAQNFDIMPSVINALKFQPEINIPDIQNMSNVIPHARGGIFSQSHIGLVAEAGREAIIPLENQSRGMALWIEAGRELGAINTANINSYAGSNNLQNMSNVIPHAKGGIFSQLHIGLVAEAGREAVIPLENQSRGMALWIEAGRELGVLQKSSISTTNNFLEKKVEGISLGQFANDSQNLLSTSSNLLSSTNTNSNDNRSNSVVLSPTFNFTINGGEQGIEQKFRQIIEDVLSDLKNDMERLSFA